MYLHARVPFAGDAMAVTNTCSMRLAKECTNPSMSPTMAACATTSSFALTISWHTLFIASTATLSSTSFTLFNALDQVDSLRSFVIETTGLDGAFGVFAPTNTSGTTGAGALDISTSGVVSS